LSWRWGLTTVSRAGIKSQSSQSQPVELWYLLSFAVRKAVKIVAGVHPYTVQEEKEDGLQVLRLEYGSVLPFFLISSLKQG
jgi:hypothetical protein